MILQPGARPVPKSPDYILIHKLGAGAFGEVWHAHGPGGVDVALKFIRLDSHLRTVELRSLEVMKSIRHPNLVSLFGAWHKDNCLILAMELCDRSLQDRLMEALQENLPGVPVDELLKYMADAANGLDALNAKQVQHRDVKPGNLLLLASGVKVADFGLAKTLEQTVASNSGAGTVAYLAPECFRGKLTQQTAQYSLAVTYYHLRTGELLFKGDQAQIMYAHLESEPDLSGLLPAEGTVVARALSKKPHERWQDCKAFVNELIAAGNTREFAVYYYNRGIAYLNEKLYRKSIEAFNQAIRLDPSDVSAFGNRGLAWACFGDLEKAIEGASEAIRLDPECVVAYYNRGLAQSDKKDSDEAIKDLDEAIRLEPNYGEAYLGRGQVSSDKKKYTSAIMDFDQAIRLCPNRALAYNERGLAWAHQENYTKAIEDYSEAIRLDPNYVQAYLNFAWLVGGCPDKNVRDSKRAIQLAIKACDLTNWKSGWVLAALADIYAEAGEIDEAVACQTKALDDPAYYSPRAFERLANFRRRHLKKETPAEEKLDHKIAHVLTTLASPEREIIILRYGLASGFPCTYEDIGQILKVTPEHARQLEAKALLKLQQLEKSNPIER
jgi:serine/threonine protein kinase